MAMKTYRMFVQERGAEKPIELTAEMVSDLRVVDFARQRLAAQAHILEIEIWSGERRLCRLCRAEDQAAISAVQLGVVAEDALSVERNAAGRG
jgi:hypothetical protein